MGHSGLPGEGRLTGDPLQTFGGFGVVEIPDFQGLLRHICENGYEHHVAVNRSQVAEALNEALTKYMGWMFIIMKPDRRPDAYRRKKRSTNEVELEQLWQNL